MPTIKTSDLKGFFSQASAIKQKSIIPVLSYLKMEFSGSIVRVTKNNMSAFIIYEMPCVSSKSATILIDEMILKNFINQTSAEDITIKYRTDKILIEDSNTKIHSPTEPAENFPINDEPDGDNSVQLGADILKLMSIASNFINEDDTFGKTGLVFIGNDHIAASNANILFIASSPTPVQLSLTKSIINAIAPFGYCVHSSNKSYDFFNIGSVRYGFIKSETPFFDLRVLLKDVSGLTSFVSGKSEIISFNDLCMASSKNPVIACTWEPLEEKLHANMTDADFGITVDRDISISSGIVPPFKYQPSLMNRLLKSAPAEELVFANHEKMLYIFPKSKSFTTLIMGYV